MKALIHNGKIVDVQNNSFDVSPSLTWVDCRDECTTSWSYENGSFVAPPSETSEEKLERLRMQRNRKLRDTDWWAMSDRTMTTEQTNYRQALRDITETYTSYEDVTWPTKPE